MVNNVALSSVALIKTHAFGVQVAEEEEAKAESEDKGTESESALRPMDFCKPIVPQIRLSLAARCLILSRFHADCVI